MRFVGIDPATKTGVVVLDESGYVLIETELQGKGEKGKGGELSIPQLVDLENQLYRIIQANDEIVIEQAAPGTQKGITTGMIHGGLRSMIIRRGLRYNDIHVSWTKKYVAETGWSGETGKKRLLKGTEKKAAIAKAVLEHFGYSHKSDNVVDAYIMARAALNLYRIRELQQPIDTLQYQLEVVQSILDKATAAGS
ncbi:hypothetical protein ACFFSY_29290 [Paenibacillus aurantiacus]|uniref:Uncharacterized protein n=1 Tax=Paenibacillus aurantiacus TaxID=1936118 RepID=A0ABV5KXU7_9BACL